jgi:hypothetical protein
MCPGTNKNYVAPEPSSTAVDYKVFCFGCAPEIRRSRKGGPWTSQTIQLSPERDEATGDGGRRMCAREQPDSDGEDGTDVRWRDQLAFVGLSVAAGSLRPCEVFRFRLCAHGTTRAGRLLCVARHT